MNRQNKEFSKFSALWACCLHFKTVSLTSTAAQSAGNFENSLFWRHNDKKFYGESDFRTSMSVEPPVDFGCPGQYSFHKHQATKWMLFRNKCHRCSQLCRATFCSFSCIFSDLSAIVAELLVWVEMTTVLLSSPIINPSRLYSAL